MDWNLKARSWDLTGFVDEVVPSIDAINGSSSYKVPRNKGDFSVDLKLGQVGKLEEDSFNKWKEPGGLKMESSPSKKARANNNGTQKFSCLVDECNSDLSNCKDYHRRHKVCELHSKTAQVMINGRKQRFCQQCSRFHSLGEFDEGKRSCRKRLDRHNRRRRKPQPLSRSASCFSNYQGTQMLPFSGLHVCPSTTIVNPAWRGVTNSETQSRPPLNQQQQLLSPKKQNLVLGSSSTNHRGGKQFAFLQGEDNALQSRTHTEASVCQPLLKAVTFARCSGGRHSMFCDRLTPFQDSDRALSLLSSPQTQTSAIGSSNMLQQPYSFPLLQPLGPSQQNCIIEPIDLVVVANGKDTAFHWPGMFHMSSDGSSGSEAVQILPFHWQ